MDDTCIIDAGDRQHQRIGACCNDNCIGLCFCNHSRSHFRVHNHFYAIFFAFCDIASYHICDIAPFPGGYAARRILPPRMSPFSYSVTAWPLCAAVNAAYRPPGPPPITITFFFVCAGLKSASLPARGFTRQVMGSPLNILGTQPCKQPDTGVHQIQSACLCLIGHFGVCDALSAEGNQVCSALRNHQLCILGALYNDRL